MDAVQRLRHRAQGAGSLQSSSEQVVSNDGDIIKISPPSTDVIYLPDYDPWCAFGPWPYNPYPPYYYAPWGGYCAPGPYLMGFGIGVFLPFAFWDWGYFDWHDHHIMINRDHFDRYHSGREPGGDVWRHSPGHRAGVPYRDPRNVRQFGGRDYRQSFRGYQGREGEDSGHIRQMPPAFRSFGAGSDIRQQSDRGRTSREIMPGGGSRGSGGGHEGGGGGRSGRSGGNR